MSQLIIQYPNDVIIEHVQKIYPKGHKHLKINHYVFVVSPLKVFAFSGNIYNSEKDDVLPIETVEMLEQSLALFTLGLHPLEIKQVLFGE